ncbi:MAG: hypothetical protein Q8P41_16835 [Pseudomonadota bacterium]|nr:hypothetical protein [Pseudomonadota bacterium]
MDPHGSTWEAWDTVSGERVLLRVSGDGEPLHADLAGLAALPLPVRPSSADWPHLRTSAIACSLADLLPIDLPPGPVWTARLALGVFAALSAIHATGHAHGWVSAESVVSRVEGWTLAWLGPVEGAAMVDDVRAASTLVAGFDPDGPIGELVAGFADDPPPSAADATRLLLHACATTLAAEHHALVRRARALGAASGRARLRRLAGRLHGSTPPPRARGRIAVDADSIALTVESDGVEIRGAHGLGAATPPAAGFVVWGRSGLDPVSARLLLRAWARREGADEDPDVAALMRWLAAASRLRVDLLLLAARG